MIAAFGVIGILGGFAASRIISPLYRAEATIWIDSRDRQQSGQTPFQPGRLLDPEAWLDLVRSYAVLDGVVRGQRLYLHADPDLAAGPLRDLAVADSFRAGAYEWAREEGHYLLMNADGVELDRALPGDSLGRSLGLQWAPSATALADGETVRFDLATLREAADVLSEQLQMHIDPEGNLLRIELEGPDRARLAPVLDQVAERYVAVAGELQRRKLDERVEILGEQLASATKDLVAAESTYQRFRTATITLPSERPAAGAATTPAGGGPAAADPTADRYFALVGSRNALRRDRTSIDRSLESGRGGGLSVEALNAVPAARESRELGPALEELTTKETELRALRARYSEAHPDVIRLTAQVRGLRDTTIPDLARALARELGTRESAAGREVAASAATLRGLPARSLEEARLRRTVALAEDLYNTVQQRHEEARLAVASTLSDARILDRPAVPRFPVQDSAPRLMAMALFGSLGLGLALVLLLDRFDPRFRYPSQISKELGLPILGAIPHMARSGGRSAPPTGPLIEALRGVRMALVGAAAETTPMIFAFSSPGSGDGKSFTTSHLAFTFAEAGYRTLLIDGDIRRGRLHQRFGIERRPGLSDVLQDDSRLSEAIHLTGYAGLSVLPCGARAHFAPELLGGAAMASLMDDLRRRFDVILCDSPPLSAGIDPYVIAATAGRLVLVLRTGVSHRELMAAKLAVLQRMPVEILGVVMNDVPPDATYGYYSYYLPGYEAKDEGTGGEILLAPG